VTRGTLRVGASGFSFPSWKPGFYPAGTKQGDFLRYYAERFATVEINNSFYKLPAEATFAKWAASVPDGFRFAVKAPRAVTVFGRVDFAPDLNARVRALGDRLGPLLVRLADTRERDDAFLERLLDAIDEDLDVALDLRDPSWDGIEPALERRRGVVRVNQLEAGAAGFRYLRLRDTPYDDATLAGWAETIEGLLADGLDVLCYFKHEDEPTAPAYAARLAGLVNG
jgi:uncharacterized protein YecE (DUF72 family)